MEVRKYNLSLILPADSESDGTRLAMIQLHKCWASVSSLNEFPKLTKMAKTLMSCFPWPHSPEQFQCYGRCHRP